jgi:hypothetical protein
MLARLNVREGQTEEQARAAFDAELGVSLWHVPGRKPTEPEPRDPAAPWWWQGDEDASQGFLASMGVTLDG